MQHYDGLGMSIPRLKIKLDMKDTAAQTLKDLSDMITAMKARVSVLEKKRFYAFSIVLNKITFSMTNGSIIWVSDCDVLASVQKWQDPNNMEFKLQCWLDSTKFLQYSTTDNIMVIVQSRTHADTVTSQVNDLAVPVTGPSDSSIGFRVQFESTNSSSQQSYVLDGIIILT